MEGEWPGPLANRNRLLVSPSFVNHANISGTDTDGIRLLGDN